VTEVSSGAAARVVVARTRRPFLRAVVAGATAAAAAGIASAVVTRALMRAVAVLTHSPTAFSIGGSAGIALIYTVALLPGCVVLALDKRRWGWGLTSSGAVLLLFEAVNIGIQETANAQDMTNGRTILLCLVLLAMTAVYAAQVYAAARWSRR